MNDRGDIHTHIALWEDMNPVSKQQLLIPRKTWRCIMKMFVAAVALATLVASPSFAQSYDPDVGSGNVAQEEDAANYLRAPLQQAPVAQDNANAFASVPANQGSDNHWPKYNRQGVDQNEPGE